MKNYVPNWIECIREKIKICVSWFMKLRQKFCLNNFTSQLKAWVVHDGQKMSLVLPRIHSLTVAGAVFCVQHSDSGHVKIGWMH